MTVLVPDFPGRRPQSSTSPAPHTTPASSSSSVIDDEEGEEEEGPEEQDGDIDLDLEGSEDGESPDHEDGLYTTPPGNEKKKTFEIQLKSKRWKTETRARCCCLLVTMLMTYSRLLLSYMSASVYVKIRDCVKAAFWKLPV